MTRNTTGLTDPGNYVLGRGKLLFAALNSSTGLPDASGFRFLGNCPNLSYSIEPQKIEHKSSITGLSVTDKTIIQSLDVSIAFTLEEQDNDNQALHVAGEVGTFTNPAVAGYAATVLTADVVKGRWYELRNASGVRAYDIEAADLTVRRDPSGTPVTLVLNTDYSLDLEMGLIFFLSTSSTVIAGDEIDTALAAEATASSPVQEIKALTTTSGLSGCLLFIQENAGNGDAKKEYRFHTVNVSADGENALIGDEIGQMQFSGSVQKNELADADSPYFTIRDHAAA